jgi:hypothetical protein
MSAASRNKTRLPPRGRGFGESARSDRVEQLRTDQEHHPGAGQREQPSAYARIGLQVAVATLDRAETDRVGHQPRIAARLDHEQAGEAAAHSHN